MWIIIIAVLVFIFSGIRIVNEYEKGVIFRLGRLVESRGPGLIIVIPIIETMRKLDLRVITMDVPSQDVITKDNIPVQVDAVVYFKIKDPQKAVISVENYQYATKQLAQTALRGVCGEAGFDEILAERTKINEKIHTILDEATDSWGISVSNVEIKHVIIPEAMQRAISKQAEAERTRRSKVILAEGEAQAAAKLKEAGEILGANPIIFRYLETMAEAAREKSNTIIFPAQMIDTLQKVLQQK